MAEPVDVNAHLHTPYSFSAFDSVGQAIDMAASEGVAVVGINDFYTLDGYGEWADECRKRHLFPLFNVEFISIDTAGQAAGLRVNDPDNPGRTYLSGKGLSYPVKLKGRQARLLSEVRNESNAQVERMCGRLNAHLNSIKAGFGVDYSWVKKELTRGLVRERHLAKALRLRIEENINESGRPVFYERLFGGKPLMSEPTDKAKVENEIRGKLLKAGGAAYVKEDPKAFLPVEIVKELIEAAGGLPTYPFLGDNAASCFTDFEGDLMKAADTLKKRGFHSAEFITTRNSTAVLESYASYLEEEGFIVSFGSEHNTPAMEPIRLRTRDDAGGLSDMLRSVNFRGACAIAAHQMGCGSVEEGESVIRRTLQYGSPEAPGRKGQELFTR